MKLAWASSLLDIVGFTAIQTVRAVRSYNSNLVRDRKLILSMQVHLIILYEIYEYYYA